MTAKPDAAKPGSGAPVTGELVTPEAAVIPSQAEENVAADRARGRTTIQVGLPGSLVAIGAWLARLGGLDLNPLADAEDMPTEITAAFIVVLTIALAFRMNPKK